MQFFRRRLPKNGEIFSQSTKLSDIGAYSRRYYKPILSFRTLGIVTIVFLLATLTILLFQSNTNNINTATNVKAAENVATSQGHNHDDDGDDDSNDSSDDDNDYRDNHDYSNYGYRDYNYVVPSVDIDTPTRWADYRDTNNYNDNYPPGPDIGNISSQILDIQQNIGGQMQACVDNARDMANQIIDLKNQQRSIQNNIDDLRQAQNNIDTSQNAGRQRYDTLDNQIQNLQNQVNSLDRGIGNAQDTYNQRNYDCQDRVGQLKQNRSDAEYALDNAFNRAMDINTDINRY